MKSAKKNEVGFIGLGIMGKPMVINLIKNEIENTLIRDFLIIEKIYQNNLFRENLLPDSGNIKIKRNGCINRNLNLWKVSTATFTN